MSIPRTRVNKRPRLLSSTARVYLMGELERFTGEGWEQEDDITLLTLERSTNP
jgi:hypothetical protein